MPNTAPKIRIQIDNAFLAKVLARGGLGRLANVVENLSKNT